MVFTNSRVLMSFDRFWRNACTDKTWQDPACPRWCENIGTILSTHCCRPGKPLTIRRAREKQLPHLQMPRGRLMVLRLPRRHAGSVADPSRTQYHLLRHRRPGVQSRGARVCCYSVVLEWCWGCVGIGIGKWKWKRADSNESAERDHWQQQHWHPQSRPHHNISIHPRIATRLLILRP